MKQSELEFIDNTKDCVWCKYNEFEFFWEKRSQTICVSPESFNALYVPDTANSALVRKEIISFLERTIGA